MRVTDPYLHTSVPNRDSNPIPHLYSAIYPLHSAFAFYILSHS